MFKNTFFTAAVLLFIFGATVSAQEAVMSSNIVDGYGPTSYFTSVGTVTSNNNITNSSPGQRFNSGSGGLITGLETIIGRESLNHPLTVSIHESNADLPTTVLGSIIVPAASVPEYDFADTPLTRFDLASLDLELAPNTDYFVSFGSAPSNSVLGNYTMRVIDPISRYGQDYVYSRNGGQSWTLPPSFFETGELPLTVFSSPSNEIILTPTVDAQAEFVDGAYEIEDGGTLIAVQTIDFIDVDRRVILEFTLPEIPNNQRIVAAELELDVGSISYSAGDFPVARVYGYMGDSAATPEDALKTDFLVGSIGPVMELEPIADLLDVEWLNTLVEDGNSEIGLLLTSGDNGRYIGIYSTEAFIPDVRAIPKLKLTLESVLLGDCNQDGVVNFSDISPFIATLSSGDYLAEADSNEDGFVDFSDISSFIALLSS